jgi:hypothetical protein
MKVAEINRLIKKHIESHLNDYEIHKDIVFKIENNFFLKGYVFESSGNSGYDLSVAYFIQPLFVKSDCLHLTFGDRLTYSKKINLFKSRKLEWWDASKENSDNSFQSIIKSIQSQGEPFLQKINTAKDFYKKYSSDKKDNIRIYEAVAYSSILFASDTKQNNLLNGLINYSKTKINRDDDCIDKVRDDATLLLKEKTTKNRQNVLKKWSLETLQNIT